MLEKNYFQNGCLAPIDFNSQHILIPTAGCGCCKRETTVLFTLASRVLQSTFVHNKKHLLKSYILQIQ